MPFGRYKNPRYPLQVGDKLCRTEEEEKHQLERMAEADKAAADKAASVVPVEDHKNLLAAFEMRGNRIAELDTELGAARNQIKALLEQVAQLEKALQQPPVAEQPQQNG